MVLVISGLVYYVVMWIFVGIDPRKGVIIPRWEPPADFTPGGVRYLRNMTFDDRCFSAGILGLAAEGKLKIREKRKSYTLLKSVAAPPTSPEAAVLLKKLFGGTTKVELDQSDHEKIKKARESYAKTLESRVDRTYFLANVRFL